MFSLCSSDTFPSQGHFTHETEGPWPVQFKHSHRWKRRSWSRFTSHYAWGTNWVCECKMDVKSTLILHCIKWNMFHGHLDYSQKPPLEGRPNTKLGDHDIPNTHNCWFILFYHVWGPTWIEIYWKSISLRDQSHMTSHYTRGFVITLHDFGGSWDGLWALSFGLSQFHGHSSWLVCEVALKLYVIVYSLTSKMSPSTMSLPLLYLETLGNGYAWFRSPSLLSHFPPIYHGF